MIQKKIVILVKRSTFKEMERKKVFYLFMPLVFIILGLLFFELQKQERVAVIEVAFITVKGTTNVDDWKITSNEASGTARIHFNNDKIEQIKNLEVIIPVESLESDNREMSAIVYKTLKSNEFPYMVFKINEVSDIKHYKDSTIINASGLLTIAGNTSPIQLDVISRVQKQKVFFEGNTSFEMTDFNIEPPVVTTKNGTIQVNDSVNVNFDVTYRLLTEPI